MIWFLTKTMQVKAIIYCRVSSKGQNNPQFGHSSLEMQSESCRKFCEDKGWKVERVISEIASAKSTKTQVEIKRVFKIKSCKKLVVMNASRFSRNVIEGTSLAKKLADKDITVCTVDGYSYSDAQERERFVNSLASAEREVAFISQRIKDSVAFRRNRGELIGRPKFGMECFRNNNGLRLARKCEAEQKIIKDIRKMIDDGKTYAQIAKYLNGKNKLRRGQKWSAQSVSKFKSNIKMDDMKKELENI